MDTGVEQAAAHAGRGPRYLSLVACPRCKGEVSWDEGALLCQVPDCKAAYALRDGIPLMLPGDQRQIQADIDAILQDPNKQLYRRRFLGIDFFKLEFWAKKALYDALGVTLPKLWDQRDYWLRRSDGYFKTIVEERFDSLEVFFQDLAIRELRKLEFTSIYEAGCGFGWNLKRFKQEFPDALVGGVDFSHTQLLNGVRRYGLDFQYALVEGDLCAMPLCDNAFDVGFSLGVFMNIHPDRIGTAIDGLIRTSRRYIVQLEYDEGHTTADLRRRRAFKTNIVSHDYERLYAERGLKIRALLDYRDFAEDYRAFVAERSTSVTRWEPWEGEGKYILIVAEKV